MKKSILLFGSVLLLLTACKTAPEAPKVDFNGLSEKEKRKAENAIYSMELYPDLEIEQFAAEPMIVNPGNIDIDEKGRIWMCEARTEDDRILILEDKDEDGRADTQTIFYQGEDINSALGIAVLGDKVYVSCSPNILILSDTNGDDIADTKDTLFTGIGGHQNDAGVHAITFGADGKLYFNFGNAGKQIYDKNGKVILDHEARPIQTGSKAYRQGLVFRCDPDGKKLEVIGHNFNNPFEVAVDSYGTKWQSDNDDDGQKGVRINYVMDYGNYGYKDVLNGNPWNVQRVGMHPEMPKRHWHSNDPGVVPNLLQTGSGSPRGMLIYEADLLPAVFRNQMIHCEAEHQVLRSYPVQKDGAGYSAKVVDIVKSKDQWFRPSDVCTAPDGSVFIADWYDPVLSGQEMTDTERGRIYRIAPNGKNYEITPPDLTTISGAIEALKSPNLSTRYLAWNELNQSGAAAETELLALYNNGTAHHQARAFYLLVRINGKTEQYINQGLKNKNPDIRIAALRAARDLMPTKLNDFIAQVINDDIAVRREAAISLRHVGDYEAAKLWTRLAIQYDGKDPWYLEALGIGADKHAELYFKTLFGHVEATQSFSGINDLVWRIPMSYTLPMLGQLIENPTITEAELPRLFRAFHFHKSPQKDQELARLLNLNHPLQSKINAYALGQLSSDFMQMSSSVQQKVKTFLPSIKGSPEWFLAVRSLQLKEEIPTLWEMILSDPKSKRTPEFLNTFFDLGGANRATQALENTDDLAFNKIIATIGSTNHPDAVELLKTILKKKGLNLIQKQKTVEALGNSQDGVHHLYDLAKSGNLDKAFHTTAALKMMYAKDSEIRSYGPKLLDVVKGNKGKMLPPIDDLAILSGDPISGQKVFDEFCNSCHMVNGEGIQFGPDLSEIGRQLGKKALYAAIIYPSGSINYGYEGFLLKDKEGTPYTGYIANQNSEEIVLRMTGGISKTFKKSEITLLQELESSLMTANLQRAMPEQELMDLVEYLSSLNSH